MYSKNDFSLDSSYTELRTILVHNIGHTMMMDCQEYERAVIFRLGLLLTGGTRGPGVFFILPCVDVYEKIDMRTQTFNVPPQEVSRYLMCGQSFWLLQILSDPHQGQCHCVCQCNYVL